MRPSFESIGTEKRTAPTSAPSFESITRPVYDLGLVDRDTRIREFMSITQELDNDTRARLVNSLYIADTYSVTLEQAYQNHDGVVSELFGRNMSPQSVMKKIQDLNKTNEERFNDYDDGYYNKARAIGKGRAESALFSFWAKVGDRYNRMGVNMVNELSGLVESVGDVTFSETLQNWSEDMRNGVREYMKENPEEFLNPGGKGFWDTTWAYVSNPEYILLGVMEQVPNIALSYVGSLVGGVVVAGKAAATVKTAKWLGGVEGFAIPSFGRRYSNLRGDGISPMIALPEAFLGSQAEGLLEHWTLTQKIKIFKGAGAAVEKSMGTIVARTLLGGAKAYGRGAFEEGTQQISDNFLAILFRDVDIGLLDEVGAQAAVGGLLEMTMAGGFQVAGSFSRQVGNTEKLRRLDTLKQKINEMPLNQTVKKEISDEIDALKGQVEEAEKAPVAAVEPRKPEIRPTAPKAPEAKGKTLKEIAAEAKIAKERGELSEGQKQQLKIQRSQIWNQLQDAKAAVKEFERQERSWGKGKALLPESDYKRAKEDTLRLEAEIAKIDDALAPPKAPEAEVGPDIVDQINRTPRYGMAEGKDGTWRVVDYETQKEVGDAGGARYVADQMNRFNSGELQVEGERRAPLLPSEKTEVTVRQLLNVVMKGMSKAARTAWIASAREQVALHKNLNKYAREQLKGLDIPKGEWSKLMTAVADIKNEAGRVAGHALIDIIADRARHTVAVKSLKKTVSWINRHSGKTRMEGGIDPDYLAKIKDLTDTFLFKKISPKQRQRVKGLVKYLEGIKQSETTTFTEQYAESRIPESLLAKVAQIELRTVDNMTALELNDINKTLQLLIHLNKTKNRILNHRTGARVAESLTGAVEEANGLIDRSTLTDKDEVDTTDRPDRATDLVGWLKGSAKSAFDFFAGNKNHDMETLTETVAGGIHGSTYDVLVNGMNDGRERQAAFLGDWQGIWEKHTEGLTIEQLQDLSHLFFQWIKNPILRKSLAKKIGLKETPRYATLKNREGQVERMTMADMLSVYMMSENMDTVNEMVKAGVATPNRRIGAIAAKDIVKIREQVEANPLAVKMVEMAKELKQYEASQINKISRQLDGIDIAILEHYWHRERFTGGGVAGHQAFRNSLLESMGWLKEREGSGNPVVIRDFFEALIADQQAISEYVGMAQPYRDIKNLLNYKEYRDILQTKGYGEELKLIDAMIERTEQRPREFSILDNAVSKIVHGLTRSVLANPGIMAGQIASLTPIFENEISSKYVSAISLSMGRDYVNRLKEHWKIYKRRVESGISSIALQEVGESDVALRTFAGKTDFVNVLLKGIHYVDSVAVTAIGRIVEAEMADGDMAGISSEYWLNEDIDPSTLEKDSPEYWDAFVKRANYVLRRTQPMFFNENRSILTSETSPTRRSLFLFRSYIDQPMRMAYRSMNNYRYGRANAKTVSKQIASIWAGLAVYEIIRAAIRKGLFRSDDDEKDLILRLLTAPVKTLNTIGFAGQKIITEVADFKMTGDPIDLRFTELTPLPLQFVNDIIQDTTTLARGIGYSGSGIRFKSGRNKGKLKSDVYLRDGVQDIFSDTLRYFGVPSRQVELLFREKKKEKKGFL